MTFPLRAPAHFVVGAGGDRSRANVIILVLFLQSELKTSIINRFSATGSFVKVGFLEIKLQSGKRTSFWQKTISGNEFNLDIVNNGMMTTS